MGHVASWPHACVERCWQQLLHHRAHHSLTGEGYHCHRAQWCTKATCRLVTLSSLQLQRRGHRGAQTTTAATSTMSMAPTRSPAGHHMTAVATAAPPMAALRYPTSQTCTIAEAPRICGCSSQCAQTSSSSHLVMAPVRLTLPPPRVCRVLSELVVVSMLHVQQTAGACQGCAVQQLEAYLSHRMHPVQAPQAGYATGYDSSYSGGYAQQSAAYQSAPQAAPVASFAPQSSGSMQPGSASYSSQMGGGYAPATRAPVPQPPAYSVQPSRVGLLTTAISCPHIGLRQVVLTMQAAGLYPRSSHLGGHVRAADRQSMSIQGFHCRLCTFLSGASEAHSLQGACNNRTYLLHCGWADSKT